MEYLTKEGDRLDQICFSYYNSVKHLEEVLKANPHVGLESLPEGIKIVFPEKISAQKELKRLWN